jgi:hypothetical protein
MPRGKGFRDRLLVVTLVRVLVFSRVIVVRSLSTISFRNVLHSSHKMATNALHNRVEINLSVRVLPIILQ